MTRAASRPPRKARSIPGGAGAGPNPQDALGFLLTDVVRLIRADFTARTRDIPLTPALHRLLFFVNRYPGCRQVELANWLDVTPVTVGRMIDRLERRNLVRRTRAPDDRRVSRVHVAAGAASLLEQLNERATETRERAVAGIAERDRTALLAALGRVRDNLQAGLPAPIAPEGKRRVR